MITNAILNAIFLVPYAIFNLIDIFSFSLTIPEDFYSILLDLTSGVAYVVPLGTILTLFNIRIGILIFKCVWSVFIRIKSFIPTMGA